MRKFWGWWLIWIFGRYLVFFPVQDPSQKVWLSDNAICVSVLHLHQQTICAKVIKQKKDKWSVAQKRLDNNNIIILYIQEWQSYCISFLPHFDQQHWHHRHHSTPSNFYQILLFGAFVVILCYGPDLVQLTLVFATPSPWNDFSRQIDSRTEQFFS